MKDEVYEFLDKPRKLRSQIIIVEANIEALKLSQLPGAIRYDKDKIQVQPEDPMAKYVVRLEELEAKREKLLEQYYESVDAITTAIYKLPEDQANVMACKYLGGKSLRETAHALNKSMGFVRYQMSMAYNTISTYC